jgi:poly(A) polymerase
MDPVGKIPPKPWMTAPETRAVIKALAAGGKEVRFVGGCVRDSITTRPLLESFDIDIATPEQPERVTELLESAGIKAIPTGFSHGTITAVIEGAHFEITTLRVDLEADGRHAKVAFIDDWQLDAARRDFTINAFSSTPEGDVFDYFNGLDDLSCGRIRFVGNAVERIEEDVLRILRFFRFCATHGRPPFDKSALAACRQLAYRLSELSGERIWKELSRLLMGQNSADIIQIMRGEKVLEHILYEVKSVGRLRLLSWLESTAIKVDSVSCDPLRRLAALQDTDREGAKNTAERLRLSKKQTVRLITLAETTDKPNPEMDEPELHRILQRLGVDITRDLILLSWADELSTTPRRESRRTESWLNLLALADNWKVRLFPVRGDDALALGLPPGPEIGDALRAVEAWWEEGGYQADRKDCLEKLKDLVGS